MRCLVLMTLVGIVGPFFVVAGQDPARRPDSRKESVPVRVPGTRVRLTPPEGFVVAKDFPGYL